MPTLKQFLSSRTNLYGIAIIVLTMLQGFVVKLPLDPIQQAGIGGLIGVGILYFRWVTTQPLVQK